MSKIARHVRRLGSVIAGVVLLGGLAGAQAADAATYYVATTGHDANPGTESAPFRTLGKGVRALKPGDTLYVKSGTYAEALNNAIPGGTSWANPVTVAAASGHTVTLRPPAGVRNGNVLRFEGSAQRYIEVRGLILDAVHSGGYTVQMAADSHHIRLRDCEVKNSVNTGIGVGDRSAYNEFINLKVHNNGDSNLDHGFYLSGANNLLENLEIFGNSGTGIQFYKKGQSTSNNNIFRNNKVYQNGGTGVFIGSGSGTTAYNNIIWGNGGNGISVNYGGTNVKVYNNTVYDNAGDGISLKSGSNHKVQNNIVYRNGGKEIVNTVTTVLTNNLADVDPQFVNAGGGDFRLRSGSPAVNTGVTLGEVRTDYSGVPRPQGGSYDIGGYEYTGGTGSASVAAPTNLRIVDALVID